MRYLVTTPACYRAGVLSRIYNTNKISDLYVIEFIDNFISI